MKIGTVGISTKELQQALRNYCAVNGEIPVTVVITSYAKRILVDLDDNGMIYADHFRHRFTGAEK